MTAAARTDSSALWVAEAQRLDWTVEPEAALDAGDPRGRWFPGGRLNVAVNCVDRHLARRGDQVAIWWEGEPGDRRALTYEGLHADVVAFAAALRGLGVQAGMRVALHVACLPETVVALLACARIGAVSCLLPVPLPVDALADRLADLCPRVLVTQDGAWRHGVIVPLKARADEALQAVPGVEHTVVIRRCGVDIPWFAGDRWFADLLQEGRGSAVDPVPVEADHPLLVNYLADRRGQPAGVVHRSGGLLVAAAALHRLALTLQPSDVLWFAVDIAWMAGLTHGVFGPLCEGGTTVLYEGALDTPNRGRCWEIVQRYSVTALATTPSVVRALRRWTDHVPEPPQVATLTMLTTLGEPIEADARAWLAKVVGSGTAVLADGWGQTELGGVVSVTADPPPAEPVPDIGMDVVDDAGASVGPDVGGELVLRRPWPGTLLGLQSGDERANRYWRWPGCYATGDAARRRAGGDVELLGRLDPVVSVSGQLVSATEVRDVLTDHPFVAAAEVVDRPEERSGQAVLACVALTPEAPDGDSVAAELRRHVADTLGGLATPRTVVIVERLPEHIERRVLRRALRMLVASHPAETIAVSGRQLAAALEAAGSR